MQGYLLRSCRRLIREAGRCSADVGLLDRVEVLMEVDQVGLGLDELEDLRLSVHHIFVLEDLFDCHDLSCCFHLSLSRQEIHVIQAHK